MIKFFSNQFEKFFYKIVFDSVIYVCDFWYSRSYTGRS